MARIDLLKKKIDAYLRKEQLMRKEEYTKLEKPFLKKARKNFTVANLMFKISEQDHFKKALTLPEDFETYEWVIVVSYYSMYVSALAALAKIDSNQEAMRQLLWFWSTVMSINRKIWGQSVFNN